MGDARTPSPEAATAARSPRATVARPARRAERDPLILRTGAPWKDLPERYPSYQTCHRRFQRWVNNGTLRRVLQALARDLHARGGLDLSETFIEGPLPAPSRCVGKTKRGKGTKIMALADRAGLPIAITIASASPHETQLVEQTLKASFLPDNPRTQRRQ